MRPGGPTPRETFKADATDPKKNVFVEFISERNAWRWDFERGKADGHYIISTVQEYDMPKTAAYVAQRVKRVAAAAAALSFGTVSPGSATDAITTPDLLRDRPAGLDWPKDR